MPLYITRAAVAQAMGCRPATVTNRLEGLPRSIVNRQHVYPLAAVLTRVKRPDHIGPLFRAATDDLSLYVGSEVMETAERLEEWLTPAMRARYRKVRAEFLVGLSSARGGAAYLPMIENLNKKSILHSEVLRHIVFGTPNQINFAQFAPAFALVNVGYEPDVVWVKTANPADGEWRQAA